jgi:N-acetyltransferase
VNQLFDTLAAPLAGTLVQLEPLAPRHHAGLRAAASDPRISRWLAAPLHEPDALARWIEQALRAAAEKREAVFAIVRHADGAVLGSTRYCALRPEQRSLEIGGTWLAPTAWRTGANVEAKLLLLARAFEHAGCVRVELKTDARNQRSRAAMELLPAQFEGIHRQHMVLPDGTLRDTAWYSIIDAEWPTVRANLERRLRPRQGA